MHLFISSCKIIGLRNDFLLQNHHDALNKTVMSDQDHNDAVDDAESELFFRMITEHVAGSLQKKSSVTEIRRMPDWTCKINISALGIHLEYFRKRLMEKIRKGSRISFLIDAVDDSNLESYTLLKSQSP